MPSGATHAGMARGALSVASAYGGQAVMEGVMMRGPAGMAVAVRLPGGQIHTDAVPRQMPDALSPWWRLPILRGLATLGDSLALGTRALLYSAELAVTGAHNDGRDAAIGETSGSGLAWTLAPSLLVAVAVFVVLPSAIAGRLRPFLPSAVAAGLIEGLIRLVLLLAYTGAIALMGDVRRILEFHGAEHKAIAALEAGLPLSPEAAASCSRFHPRCGTSFLLFVVLLAGFVFALLGWQALWLRVLLRLVLLPLVAGVGYEVLRASARGAGGRATWIVAPGLWLQRLTTREPDRTQLEVALAALREAMAMAGEPSSPVSSATILAQL